MNWSSSVSSAASAAARSALHARHVSTHGISAVSTAVVADGEHCHVAGRGPEPACPRADRHGVVRVHLVGRGEQRDAVEHDELRARLGDVLKRLEQHAGLVSRVDHERIG